MFLRARRCEARYEKSREEEQYGEQQLLQRDRVVAYAPHLHVEQAAEVLRPEILQLLVRSALAERALRLALKRLELVEHRAERDDV